MCAQPDIFVGNSPPVDIHLYGHQRTRLIIELQQPQVEEVEEWSGKSGGTGIEWKKWRAGVEEVEGWSGRAEVEGLKWRG